MTAKLANIQFHFADIVLPVRVLAVDYMIMKRSVNLKPCMAEIQMNIGRCINRWAIFLVNGMTEDESRVKIKIAPTRSMVGRGD